MFVPAAKPEEIIGALVLLPLYITRPSYPDSVEKLVNVNLTLSVETVG